MTHFRAECEQNEKMALGQTTSAEALTLFLCGFIVIRKKEGKKVN